MARTLIANGYVVTVNGKRDVLPGGYVAIEGNSITDVGLSGKSPEPDGFDEVIDASDCVVLPGLINMHQHHWYTLFKGLADGYLLEDWVMGFLLPLSVNLTEEAMRVSSQVAAMEMLSTGTTCSLNHSVTTTTPEMVAATIEPQRDIGIRQVYGKELRCRTPGNPNHPLNLEAALAAYEEEHKRWEGDGDGLVRMAMAIESNAHWVASGMSTEELICRGYELARKLNVKITNHVSGGTFSLEKGFLKYLRETGRTDVRYLMQLGLLDPSWILIHGIHVTELDIEQMAHVGCGFVYTPTSESIRGGGIGPIANAHDAGVTVALGTDGPMVDYSVDMLEQMKACTLMQHLRHLDPTRMPVTRAIEMATINAAQALGLDRELGSIEPGKLADIAIFDLDRPYVGVTHNPISSLVFSGKGSDAKAVIVNGTSVYKDGSFINDPGVRKVIKRAQGLGAGIVQQAKLGARLEQAWQ